jgi:putative FmdB family regulatory protein
VPTYSYRCTECDNAFDIVQSFTDDTLSVCPVCQGKLRKVFSPVGVTFNGSGFYRTDSRGTAGSGGGTGDRGGRQGCRLRLRLRRQALDGRVVRREELRRRVIVVDVVLRHQRIRLLVRRLDPVEVTGGPSRPRG